MFFKNHEILFKKSVDYVIKKNVTILYKKKKLKFNGV